MRNPRNQPNDSEDRARPITLHVETVAQVDLKYVDRERISVIDIEMSQVEAEAVLKLIREQLQTPGAISVRFIGRMVLS